MCIAFRQAMDVPHFTQLQMDVSIEKEMDGCGARVGYGSDRVHLRHRPPSRCRVAADLDVALHSFSDAAPFLE